MSESGFASFSLHERVLKALDKLSLSEPTVVQSGSLPEALSGKDMLISARTGSGKTIAYLLPLVEKMLASDAPKSATRAVVLVPTRELARQVHKDCESLLAFTQIKAGLVTGGEGLKVQSAQLRKNPEVIIATPGRVGEHLQRRSMDLSDIEFLVLDEADRMLDLGFQDDLIRIAKEFPQTKQHQALMCSATLSHDNIRELSSYYLEEPVVVDLVEEEDQPDIVQQVVLADNIDHKKKLLNRLLSKDCEFRQAMVFTNTRDMAEQLGNFLNFHFQKNEKRIRSAVLHGEMEHPERKRIMNLFRDGKVDVLVATDVAARGLDIDQVELVVNFDMSRKGDDYLHRIGRTGRAGRSGLAISFITSNEWNLMSGIERYLKVHFERRTVPGLEGVFKGPKKLKASGKAAATSKRSDRSKNKPSNEKKSKQRLRDKKAIGKRRKPAVKTEAESRLGDGFVPLKKKN